MRTHVLALLTIAAGMVQADVPADNRHTVIEAPLEGRPVELDTPHEEHPFQPTKSRFIPQADDEWMSARNARLRDNAHMIEVTPPRMARKSIADELVLDEFVPTENRPWSHGPANTKPHHEMPQSQARQKCAECYCGEGLGCCECPKPATTLETQTLATDVSRPAGDAATQSNDMSSEPTEKIPVGAGSRTAASTLSLVVVAAAGALLL